MYDSVQDNIISARRTCGIFAPSAICLKSPAVRSKMYGVKGMIVYGRVRKNVRGVTKKQDVYLTEAVTVRCIRALGAVDSA